jgi:hypothetical protein
LDEIIQGRRDHYGITGERRKKSMQIDFASSGGFANMDLTFQAETSTMPEEQAREIAGLVEESHAFDLKQEDANPNATVGRADVISYRLSLSDGNKQTTLWLNDVTAPASIRPLLSYLRKLAVEERRMDGDQNP